MSKKVGAFTVVDEISFSVGKREIFGFLGPNSAGKTMTISMLCTLLRPIGGLLALPVSISSGNHMKFVNI